MTADDAARPPEVIRRREVRHTSARSLLMTVLGEFVLPAGRPVWTWLLVDTLAADGRVFMDNSPNECFVAAAPDEAIVVLAQGRALTFL